jgi:glycosyltransferase involved in cell wall biosynthesis
MIDGLTPQIAVVIPCFNVRDFVLGVISGIGEEVKRIYVVDDGCPQGTGAWVKSQCQDARVVVICHAQNQGVGGAVITGYAAAIADGMEIIVKMDGDGQMDPSLLLDLVAPILEDDADYTKGNRFFDLDGVDAMPKLRLVGNAVLSFMTKLSSGYWDIFDPTNGYTAIHRDVVQRLPFEKISRSFFFETDILFRLNTLRAVVIDVAMPARYGDEVSNLRVASILGEFLHKHVRNLFKRIFYNYYLRDMSVASIELPVGLLLMAFGFSFGAYHWINSMALGQWTPVGTVMLAAMPILVGLQFVLAFVASDIASVPRRVRHRRRVHGQSGKSL